MSVTPSTARTAPDRARRANTPARIGKCVTRSVTASIGRPGPAASAAGVGDAGSRGCATAATTSSACTHARADARRIRRRPPHQRRHRRGNQGGTAAVHPPSRTGTADGTRTLAAPARGSAAGPGSVRASPAGPGPSASARPAGRPCRRGAARRTASSLPPSSTIRPAYITAIRSACAATRPRSWVISTIAVSRSACSRSSTSMIWACTVTSSAVVGSSAMSTAGSLASAIAIIARCRMPPENSCGYCRARSPGLGMPTSASRSTARAARRGLRRPRVRRDHLGDLVADAEHRVERRQRVLEDHREVARRACAAAAPRAGRAASGPRSRTVPERVVAPGTSPMTVIAETDLPDPDSPTIASVSPASTCQLTPSTALTTPAGCRSARAGRVPRAVRVR